VRFLITICASLALLTSGPPAFAQAKAANKQAKQKWVGPKSTPRQQLELLLEMPPEQREQYLAMLPQAQRTQLENLEKLPPEKRDARLRELDILNSLTPDRKQAVRQEINRIAAMKFVQRRAHMHTQEFEQSFTAPELELLRSRFPNAAN
jgi:predicted NAD/FAD-binding protein